MGEEAGEVRSRSRPFGVVVTSIWLILTGLTGALVVTAAALGIDDIVWDGVPLLGEWTRVMTVGAIPIHVVGVASGLVALACFVVAVGFWRLRSWGWTGLMLLAATTLTINLIAVVLGDANEASLLVAILAVLYANQRKIQFLFRGEHVRAFEASPVQVRADA